MMSVKSEDAMYQEPAQQMKKPYNSIKYLTDKYVKSTTIHGLCHVYNSKTWPSRLFHLVTFLAVLSTLIYLVIHSIQKGFRFDIYTIQKASIVKSMPFPSVTFCTTNPFSISSMMNFIQRNNITVDQYKDRKELYDRVATGSIGDNALNTTDIYSKLHILKCQFGEVKCDLEKDFVMSATYLRGRCYTYRPSANLQQEFQGSIFGLQVVLALNHSDHDPLLVSPSDAAGVFVSVHEKDDPAFPELDGTLLSPGKLTRIQLKKQQMSRLPHPFPDNCYSRDEVPIEQYMGKRYSKHLCALNCLLKVQLQICKSVDPKWYQFITHRHLLPKDAGFNTTCLEEKKAEILKAIKIACGCRPVCEEEIYISRVSQTDWPSNSHLKYYLSQQEKFFPLLNGTVTPDVIKESVLKVEIFFESFQVMIIEQRPAYSWKDMPSDIGGLIGLWIGASIYSVLELLVFLWKISIHFCLSKLNASSG